jgi:hypothetical protein
MFDLKEEDNIQTNGRTVAMQKMLVMIFKEIELNLRFMVILLLKRDVLT